MEKTANLKTLGHKQDALEELRVVCFRDKDSRRCISAVVICVLPMLLERPREALFNMCIYVALFIGLWQNGAFENC